jgi:hypothetical protein
MLVDVVSYVDVGNHVYLWLLENMVWSRVWKCLCLGFRIAGVERGVRVVRGLLRSKRRLLVAAVLCVVLVAGLGMLWRGGRVAEAAVLVPHPGLVGWWRFDEGTGSVAGDSSGNGNNGTVHGATWVTGKYGKALSFNGTSSYVDIPLSNSLKGFTELTISFWAKKTSTVDFAGLVADDYGSGRQWDLLDHTNGVGATDNICFYITDGVAGDTLLSSHALPIGVWQYVTVVFKGSNFIKFYINGAIDTQKSTTLSQTNPTPVFDHWIGRYSSYYFNGIIDEVRIYNRALSAAEIQSDFQKSPDFSSKLLAKVPKGTTQIITTLSWQGIGSINVTIQSPSQNYTEGTMSEYQKTVYSTSGGTSSMLNIKRVSVTVNALSSDQNWYVILTYSAVDAYQITVEVQK